MSHGIGEDIVKFDREHIWHPYSSMTKTVPAYPVKWAKGVRLILEDGTELIDGMSSWWTAIHGYNHPELNKAISTQIESMAHVMFGGLTHSPAVELASLLLDLAPAPLDKVFFCDSGSVSVEVAIKMAFQYWYSRGRPEKHRLLTLRSGYHGDTFGAMSVCDPEKGMHKMYTDILPAHFFAEAPRCGYYDKWDENDIGSLKKLLETRSEEIAAVIFEPIVQGAGGMRFYSPEYVRRARELCDSHNVLLVLDEIATGFGRTGTMFACDQAGISPDIMCIGKAMTGGYMTLAATLASSKVSEGICTGGAGVLMHGPTFMANPLACSVASASIRLLLSSSWEENVRRIQRQMRDELEPCKKLSQVSDVRVLGAIGVVELKEPVELAEIQKLFVQKGVWIRPFGRLVYIMPPYIISESELRKLTGAICEVLAEGKGA